MVGTMRGDAQLGFRRGFLAQCLTHCLSREVMCDTAILGAQKLDAQDPAEPGTFLTLTMSHSRGCVPQLLSDSESLKGKIGW